MIEDSAVGAREIGEGVWELDAPFWGYKLSLYLIESDGRWALVDTGMSSAPEEFIFPFLERHGGLEARILGADQELQIRKSLGDAIAVEHILADRDKLTFGGT